MDEVIAEFFESKGRLESLDRGQVIIGAHDKPSGIFYIESGYIKTYSITKYGETNLHLIRKAGEVLPIIWALTDLHREVFYEAISECQLRRVSKRAFKEFAESSAEIQSKFVGQAIELYRIHADRVNNLQLRTAKERLAYRVLALANRFGRQVNRGVLIDVPLRHQDIADSINTARETTSRELEKLQKNGIIDYNDHDIILLDQAKLKEIVD